MGLLGSLWGGGLDVSHLRIKMKGLSSGITPVGISAHDKIDVEAKHE